MNSFIRRAILLTLLVGALALPAMRAEDADEDKVTLMPMTPEIIAAAARALDGYGYPPHGHKIHEGVNKNGVYMLTGDIFRNGEIYAILDVSAGVTVCQWQDHVWKPIHRLNVGTAWRTPNWVAPSARLSFQPLGDPNATKPFWIVTLENHPLLVVASDVSHDGQIYYAVLFDEKCRAILDSSPSVGSPPRVKSDYLITQFADYWWVTSFSQIQNGKLAERKSWHPSFAGMWVARSDNEVFRIFQGNSSYLKLARMFESLSPSSPEKKIEPPADWVICRGKIKGSDYADRSVSASDYREPWARIYHQRSKARETATNENLKETELPYLFVKLTGLPKELYPNGQKIGFRGRLFAGAKMIVTGNKDAVALLAPNSTH